MVITATKGFFEPEQMATVLDEIGGKRGPVLDPSLERTRTFGTTAYDFAGTLDLSRGIATFSDRQLTRLLDGFPIGQDQAALEEELGAPLSDLTSFTFEVVLPDGSEPQTSTWEAHLGDEPTAMAASTEERNLLAFGLAAGAVAGRGPPGRPAALAPDPPQQGPGVPPSLTPVPRRVTGHGRGVRGTFGTDA